MGERVGGLGQLTHSSSSFAGTQAVSTTHTTAAIVTSLPIYWPTVCYTSKREVSLLSYFYCLQVPAAFGSPVSLHNSLQVRGGEPNWIVNQLIDTSSSSTTQTLHNISKAALVGNHLLETAITVERNIYRR